MLIALLHHFRTTAALTALVSAGIASQQATTQPADPPPAATTQPTNPAHALLDRIADADKDLLAIAADIRKTKKEKVLRRTEIHQGSVIYLVERPESDVIIRQFAVLFDMRYHGSGSRLRQDERDDHYIFDGRWFADVNHADKQFVKTEIAPPGEFRDPLKLGEGPFPLPIGQDRDEVLARFNVTDAPLPEEGPLAKLPRDTTQGIHLVPRPNTPMAEDYTSFDIFYNLDLNLPVGVAITHRNGDLEWVLLTNVRRNPELTPEEKAKLNIETPSDPAWRIDIRPWSG